MAGRSTLLGLLVSVTEKLASEFANGKLALSDFKQQLKTRVQEALAGLRCSEEQRRLLERRVHDVIEGELRVGNSVVALEAVLEDRGLVGASSGVLNAVLEVGLAWDHLLDLPLVPGSSFKGAVRSLLLQLCATRVQRDKRSECLGHVAGLLGWLPGVYDIEQVVRLLGLKAGEVEEIAKRHAHAGLLVFHDAHLVCNNGNNEGRLLEPWVITPHYRDAVTEYDARPVPVEHVVLAPGLRGVFVVGVKRDAENHLKGLAKLLGVRDCSGRTCLVFLSQLLGAALASGVGARTSRGYSRFSVEKVYVRW